MTLVASFCFGGLQVLLADGLLTDLKGRDRSGIQLPAFGPVEAIKAKRSGIAGLTQKLCLVGNNMVVGFAAQRMKAAETVVTELNRKSKSGPFTAETLTSFLAFREPLLSQAALIGFVATNGIAKGFHIHSENFHSQELGAVTAAGTGTSLLKSLTEKAQVEQDAARSLSADYKAACKGLIINGLLLSQEFHDASTISSYCGGTYEIAYFSQGRFVKPDVTDIIWKVDIRKGKIFHPLPKLIIKNHYIGEDLYVNAARWGEISDPIAEDTWNFDLHRIPAIANRFPNSLYASGMEIGKSIGFSSTLTVNIFVCQADGGIEFIPHLEIFSSRMKISFLGNKYFVEWGENMEDWVQYVINKNSAAH